MYESVSLPAGAFEFGDRLPGFAGRTPAEIPQLRQRPRSLRIPLQIIL